MSTTSKTTGNTHDSRIVRAKVATKSGRYLQFNIDPRTHSEARYCVSVVNRFGVGVSMSTIVRLAIARYAADMRLAGLRPVGEPSRPQGPRAGEGVLVLLSRPCARIQSFV